MKQLLYTLICLKMRSKIIWFLVTALTILYACNMTDKATIILNKNVDELFVLSQNAGQLLCLFLGGGGQCNNCIYQIKQLQQEKVLSAFGKNYIFGSCNAGDTANAYLHHCLIMSGLPSMYIFSPEGRLLSFMTDVSNPELVRVMLESTLGGDPRPLIKHPEFQVSFQDLLDMQNHVLCAYHRVNQAGNDTMKLKGALSHVQQAVKIEPYFFNLYLCSEIHRKLGNSDLADSCAYEALKICKSGFQQAVYASYIEKLKKRCPRFLEEEKLKAHLAPENKIIRCGNLNYNTTKEFVFKYTNNGKQPLIIFNVSSACNCVSLQWSEEPLLPGKSEEIKITFRADKKGKFSRTIFVISNASNQMERLTMEGVVN